MSHTLLGILNLSDSPKCLNSAYMFQRHNPAQSSNDDYAKNATVSANVRLVKTVQVVWTLERVQSEQTLLANRIRHFLSALLVHTTRISVHCTWRENASDSSEAYYRDFCDVRNYD